MALQNIGQRNSGGQLFIGSPDVGERNDGLVEDLTLQQIGTRNDAGLVTKLGSQAVPTADQRIQV